MARRLAVLSRSAAINVVRQYVPVVLGIAGAAGLSLLLRRYLYPRPLFLLSLVFSIWGRGLGPGLVGAALATVIVRLLFPELLPPYGLFTDITVFGLGAVAISAFSDSKLRAEVRRKRVEDQLRMSERMLIDAQRLAQVGSWERTLETDAICWSDEMLRILGRPNEPPAHFLTFLSCVHPEDQEKIRETDYQIRLTAGPIVVEYRIVRPDGEVRFVRSVVGVIRNDQDAPVRIVGATQDVTEQVKAR